MLRYVSIYEKKSADASVWLCSIMLKILVNGDLKDDCILNCKRLSDFSDNLYLTKKIPEYYTFHKDQKYK